MQFFKVFLKQEITVNQKNNNKQKWLGRGGGGGEGHQVDEILCV